jgi:hypothetical protein
MLWFSKLKILLLLCLHRCRLATISQITHGHNWLASVGWLDCFWPSPALSFLASVSSRSKLGLFECENINFMYNTFYIEKYRESKFVNFCNMLAIIERHKLQSNTQRQRFIFTTRPRYFQFMLNHRHVGFMAEGLHLPGWWRASHITIWKESYSCIVSLKEGKEIIKGYLSLVLIEGINEKFEEHWTYVYRS